MGFILGNWSRLLMARDNLNKYKPNHKKLKSKLKNLFK